MTSENYEQSYRAQINEKVLSTRLFKLCGSDLMRPRYRYRHSPGGKSLFPYTTRKSRFSYCWKLSQGEREWRSFFACWELVERRFSHIVGVGGISVGWKVTFLILLGVGWKRTFLTWFGVGREGHFLALLGVVGRKINFSILLGRSLSHGRSRCNRPASNFKFKIHAKMTSILLQNYARHPTSKLRESHRKK